MRMSLYKIQDLLHFTDVTYQNISNFNKESIRYYTMSDQGKIWGGERNLTGASNLPDESMVLIFRPGSFFVCPDFHKDFGVVSPNAEGTDSIGV